MAIWTSSYISRGGGLLRLLLCLLLLRLVHMLCLLRLLRRLLCLLLPGVIWLLLNIVVLIVRLLIAIDLLGGGLRDLQALKAALQ